jgi:hypothetical protein
MDEATYFLLYCEALGKYYQAGRDPIGVWWGDLSMENNVGWKVGAQEGKGKGKEKEKITYFRLW